ncbi:Transposase [Butyrivibrio fibrisolvens 16/4]|nr:Transposase [Butyrivibrio fibrisolvens 16/4]
MSYNRYSKEMKESIVVTLLEEDVVVMEMQKETGVGINTLYRWRD